MKKLVLLLSLTLGVSCTSSPAPAADPQVSGWQTRAQGVTIVRDDWGVPHVYGKTDADAVFGVMYAQAEDDFNRVETNFLNSMGRLAEAEGEAEIWRDLRMKLFIDPDDLKVKYQDSPDWLQALMNAWADGLNYYLHTHPETRPRVIQRFEPWMALSFSEGSIGGDIERVSLAELEAFYGGAAAPRATAAAAAVHAPASGLVYADEPTGSNGFAIGPSKSASGKALLWINPHTSFFFREEAQMVSEEGLNAYGAITWGQFFIYQGFNERAGWMHTSSGADNIDEYLESVIKKENGVFYRYGDEERAMTSKRIVVPYKTAGGMAQREFTVYRTHHGPVVREVNGKWVAVRLMEEPVKALTQSYRRTKATNLASFRETMELHTNSSNNTVFADAEGNIAYFHANFVPKRDARIDWTAPVDGSTPATEWQGAHSIDESPNMFNPANGWIQNTNNWPYSVSGPSSPKEKDYPAYMDRSGENPRGVHAIRVLQAGKAFTMETLRDAAFDSAQPEFENLIPGLVKAYDQLQGGHPLKGSLASFGARPYSGTKRWYGTSGNSFVAVVEFGDRVRARAVTAGGLNADPSSKHFTDQAERYAAGNLRDVYFYRDQLQGHIEREYKPGQ
jgi:acyl-homoserine-lactone acylase